ncbi:serine hydrolase domain-containing protein [Chryseolinea sp. H1M3-3]|uniref:serine hydrolase domain-containing protein n=1 Tax=Chryseolinea sp. H1M3-3 TaxID=3034144 RepID=UPI0023EB401A|nr:serine hydrolase domain-containing protein [Chryseolinea sp. H1M3-3]
MLVDQGKISLEDDIRKYLPEMPDYGTPITIANLVYHTSGIRSTDDLQFAGFGPQDITTLPICLNFAFAQKQLLFNPGARYNYSNTNYNLLVEIVSRVTGTPFSEWCKENIFRPYGMNNTWFKTDIGQVAEHGVHCYSGTKDGFVELQNNWAATGASGLQTSIDDLEKWLIGIESRQHMNDRIYKLLNTTTTLKDGSPNKYVFGNEVVKNDNKNEVAHLGLVLGFRTAILRYPDQKLSIVYLSNDGNDATYQRAWKIRDIFLGTNTENLPDLNKMPTVEGALKQIENAKKYRETVDVNPYVGTYFSEELSTVWTLKNEDGQLVIHHPRIHPIKLKSSSKDQFSFLQFVRDDSDDVIGLKILGGGIVFDKK